MPKKDSMGMDYIPVYERRGCRRRDGQDQSRQNPENRGSFRAGRAPRFERAGARAGNDRTRRTPRIDCLVPFRRFYRVGRKRHDRPARSQGPALDEGLQPRSGERRRRICFGQWRKGRKRNYQPGRQGSAAAARKSRHVGTGHRRHRTHRRTVAFGAMARAAGWRDSGTQCRERHARRTRRGAVPHRRSSGRMGRSPISPNAISA